MTGKGKMDVHPSCLVGIQYGGVPARAENIKIPDMLNKTVDILESDTIFRTALYSNINAFHQALHADQNIKDMKAQMEDLKTSMKLQFAEMGERIRNLEKENAELKNEEQGEREVSAEKPQSSSSRKTE